MTTSPPYAELDPGIIPLVRLLNSAGFATICSCEGGEGHAFKRPTVLVQPAGDLDEQRKALCAALIQGGLEGFSVKTVSMHQRSVTLEPYSYLAVELWR